MASYINHGTSIEVPTSQLPASYQVHGITKFTGFTWYGAHYFEIEKSTVEDALKDSTINNIVAFLTHHVDSLVQKDFNPNEDIEVYSALVHLDTNQVVPKDLYDNDTDKYLCRVNIYVRIASAIIPPDLPDYTYFGFSDEEVMDSVKAQALQKELSSNTAVRQYKMTQDGLMPRYAYIIVPKALGDKVTDIKLNEGIGSLWASTEFQIDGVDYKSFKSPNKLNDTTAIFIVE